MAKKIAKNIIVNSADDLVTSREKTREGFIKMALEKNYMATPYINKAKMLKSLASNVKNPMELLTFKDIRIGMLAASGLSDKSLKFLSDEDKTLAIKGLIENFLIPAGEDFINELVYRYLLTRGDAIGGQARNLAGLMGERKFLSTLLSGFYLAGIDYQWMDKKNRWNKITKDDLDIEKRIKALCWNKGNGNRLLIMNTKVPIIGSKGNNVDLIILKGSVDDLKKGSDSIIQNPNKYISLGELKGGIDPAGADEHWKTASKALDRIREGFDRINLKPSIFFIGAAIENNMAIEIFNNLESGVLNNAANLTNDDHLAAICDWVINL